MPGRAEGGAPPAVRIDFRPNGRTGKGCLNVSEPLSVGYADISPQGERVTSRDWLPLASKELKGADPSTLNKDMPRHHHQAALHGR